MSELPPEETQPIEESNRESEVPDEAEPINVVAAGPPPQLDDTGDLEVPALEETAVDEDDQWSDASSLSTGPLADADEIGDERPASGKKGGIPIWIAAVLGIVVLLVIGGGIVAAVVLLGGSNSGERITLTTEVPTFALTDSFVLELASGEQVQVNATTQQISDAAVQDAVGAIPPGLTAVSPIYIVSPRGGAVDVKQFGFDAAMLDVYYWDSSTGSWLFAPSAQAGSAKSVQVADGANVEFAFFQREQQQPTTAIIATEGGSNPGVGFSFGIAEAAFVDASGTVQTRSTPDDVTTGYTLIENREGGFGAYNDPAQRQALIGQMTPLLDSATDGLVLDFVPGDGYVAFITELQAAAAERGKRIEVLIPVHEYDAFPVAALGASADRVWLVLSDDPNTFVYGTVDMQVTRFVGDVERIKAGVIVNALNVSIGGDGRGTSVSLDEAAAFFGQIQAVEGYLDENNSLPATEELAVRLSGNLEALGTDEVLQRSYLVYRDEFGSLNTVYFASAQGLANDLAVVRQFNLNAGAVYGLAHPDTPQGVAAGLTAFANNQPAEGPTQANLSWRVEAEDGSEVASASGDLTAIQYLWQTVEEQGSYTIRALFGLASSETEIASLSVTVGDVVVVEEPEEEEEEPEEVAEVTPEPESDNEEPVDEPTPAPPPPPAGTIQAGIFELGGQTQNLANPDAMRRAGMNWVKFQHKWSPGDDAAGALSSRIAAAQGQGFKVLFSIPGQLNPTTPINYAAYVDFLAQAAALGPDAIEVWNEQNITREWPPGQISGVTYTNEMLAPAYAAIKGANPNVLVIAGAPAPTGFFGGCTPDGCDDWLYVQEMANAGASNHMDCMGVHYNEGIISPTLRQGDPRDGFYSRYFFGMVDTYSILGKPLCFTELGYLTADGFGSLPPAFGWAGDTSVAEQAQWLAEAAVLSSESGIVRMMIVFNVDFTLYGDDPQAGFAMIRPDGSCPACDALGAVQP